MAKIPANEICRMWRTIGLSANLAQRVLLFFREAGAQGGKARAEKHTPQELSQWGKMGGRPPRKPPERSVGGYRAARA